MNKKKFLKELRGQLTGLPEKDIEKQISFYEEIINDRVSEEKITEEEAVLAIGSVEDIASQIIIETPILKLANERIKREKRLSWWEKLIIILGSPVWVSILIAIFAVVFAVYISFWAVIISLWSVFFAVLASGLSVTVLGFSNLFAGNLPEGLATIGGGIAAVGISIFVFFGCRAVTKGFIWLTKKIVLAVKNCFIKRRAA